MQLAEKRAALVAHIKILSKKDLEMNSNMAVQSQPFTKTVTIRVLSIFVFFRASAQFAVH